MPCRRSGNSGLADTSRNAGRSLSKEGLAITSAEAIENLPHAQWPQRDCKRMLEDAQRIHSYTELQQQIHDDLPIQHPEWVEPNGNCPTCDSYELRLADLLGLA